MTVWFATGNKNKKKELSDILSCELKIPSEAGFDFDPVENGNSFLENAFIKAEELYRLLEGRLINADLNSHGGQHDGLSFAVIADDSGICVDALDGRPGIYSARYGAPDVKSEKERNEMLLSELGNNPRRSARFVCSIVLYFGPNRFFAAQETMEGEVVGGVEDARGSNGFGYDPILYIPELGRTVAELTDTEKSRFSHRGKAGKIIANILSGIKAEKDKHIQALR